MHRACEVLLVLLLAVALSGCLGTIVRTPARGGRPTVTTSVHILAAPNRIDAHQCPHGMAETARAVPLWGIAVGILTLGILVPMTTSYRCVAR